MALNSFLNKFYFWASTFGIAGGLKIVVDALTSANVMSDSAPATRALDTWSCVCVGVECVALSLVGLADYYTWTQPELPEIRKLDRFYFLNLLTIVFGVFAIAFLALPEKSSVAQVKFSAYACAGYLVTTILYWLAIKESNTYYAWRVNRYFASHSPRALRLAMLSLVAILLTLLVSLVRCGHALSVPLVWWPHLSVCAVACYLVGYVSTVTIPILKKNYPAD